MGTGPIFVVKGSQRPDTRAAVVMAASIKCLRNAKCTCPDCASSSVSFSLNDLKTLNGAKARSIYDADESAEPLDAAPPAAVGKRCAPFVFFAITSIAF